jgi:hypothetical protein
MLLGDLIDRRFPGLCLQAIHPPTQFIWHQAMMSTKISTALPASAVSINRILPKLMALFFR